MGKVIQFSSCAQYCEDKTHVLAGMHIGVGLPMCYPAARWTDNGSRILWAVYWGRGDVSCTVVVISLVYGTEHVLSWGRNG